MHRSHSPQQKRGRRLQTCHFKALAVRLAAPGQWVTIRKLASTGEDHDRPKDFLRSHLVRRPRRLVHHPRPFERRSRKVATTSSAELALRSHTNVFSHLTLALCATANGLPEMSLWVKSVALRAGVVLPLATVIATCRTVPRCQGATSQSQHCYAAHRGPLFC